MSLFAFSGVMGSGKDTAAEYLIKEKNYKQVVFAKNLKEMCKEIFGLNDYQCYDTEGKFKDFKEPIVFTDQHLVLLEQYNRNKNGLQITDFGLAKGDQFLDAGHEFANPRELLQKIGTEYCREVYGQGYHTDVVRKELGGNVVITDCRFPNERNFVKKNNGILILLKGRGAGESSHASENSLGEDSEYDYVIHNTGSISDLHQSVSEIYQFYDKG